MRILVTGSRDWKDAYVIESALFFARWSDQYDGEMVVAHGDSGNADKVAAAWAERTDGVRNEPHPADWDKHGKAAGPIRNSEMVEAGADVCLAFIKNNSRGATDCADKAEAAGIPTRRLRG